MLLSLQILALRERNSNLPEMEQLELDEFHLDKEKLEELRINQGDRLREVRVICVVDVV